MMQPRACLAIARQVKALGLDVIIYSGFKFEELINSFNDEVKRTISN